jgi:hypothetical protein
LPASCPAVDLESEPIRLDQRNARQEPATNVTVGVINPSAATWPFVSATSAAGSVTTTRKICVYAAPIAASISLA